MKNITVFLLLVGLCMACEENDLEVNKTIYECTLSQAEPPHARASEFQAILDDAALIMPGLQVAVRSSDGNTWTGAAGMADIFNGVPLENCHRLMVGSISKIFTAVLILQLQDEGILSIKDSLNAWLDESITGRLENADSVNLEQLLNHTSGLRDYLGVKQHIDAVNTPYFQETQTEKLEYAYDKAAYHAPGERFTYSNTNYVLLGLVIEKARQMPLWDAVQLHILDPLGLNVAKMGTHEQPIPVGTARPYVALRNNKYFDILQNAVSDAATGDGGIASNTQDLRIFMEHLFAGDLISENSMTQMIEIAQVAVGEEQADFSDWPNETYGLGLSRFNTPYGAAYGHTGSTTAYTAYLFHFPEQGATLAIAYNAISYASSFWEKQEQVQKQFLELMFE